MKQWIQGLDTDDKRSLGAMGATVVLLHVLGFGVLLLVLLPAAPARARRPLVVVAAVLLTD